MTLETHASLDRHLSIKDIARGIADDWNPSEEACAEAERIWANVERLRGPRSADQTWTIPLDLWRADPHAPIGIIMGPVGSHDSLWWVPGAVGAAFLITITGLSFYMAARLVVGS